MKNEHFEWVHNYEFNQILSMSQSKWTKGLFLSIIIAYKFVSKRYLLMKKIILLTILAIFSSVNIAQDFAEISFIDSTRGLLIYSADNSHKATLFSTTDKGNSWFPILEGSSLKSIYQFNTNKIFVGYESSGYAYSFDGGTTWAFEDFGKSEANVKQIEFVDENYGWISTDKVVFVTSDGGTSWIETGTEQNWKDLFSINLYKVDKGWLLKEDGQVFTFNSSTTPSSWLKIGDLGGTCYGANAGITFADSMLGYSIGTRKSYKSTDGGTSWEYISYLFDRGIHGYEVINENSFYVCGDRGISFSEDGGRTFQTQYSEVTQFCQFHLSIVKKVGQ